MSVATHQENSSTGARVEGAGPVHADFTRKRVRPGEFVIEKSIATVSFFSIAFIVLIFVFVLREASSIVTSSSPAEKADAACETPQCETYGDEMLDSSVVAYVPKEDHASNASGRRALVSNLLGRVWQPVSLDPKYGIIPLFTGSLKVALIAILIGAPFAIFAALYTSTFAPKWAKEIMKPVIEILAGFPSVVIGFFALIILASLIQSVLGLQYRLNAFVGGLALSLAVIPIIFTISEDALVAVPKSLTEASMALGARKWETALYVVLPAATPGIFAAVLLGVSRAIGETMIVLMATGNAALLSFSPFDSVRTISATIGAEMAEVVFGDRHYSVLFLLGIVLFMVSFTLNVVAEVYVRQKLMKKFRGG